MLLIRKTGNLQLGTSQDTIISFLFSAGEHLSLLIIRLNQNERFEIKYSYQIQQKIRFKQLVEIIPT